MLWESNELNPNLSGYWLRQRASSKGLWKNITSAIKCFDKEGMLRQELKKRFKGHSLTGILGKGHALTRLGKYEDAVKCFDKMKEMDTKCRVMFGSTKRLVTN